MKIIAPIDSKMGNHTVKVESNGSIKELKLDSGLNRVCQ